MFTRIAPILAVAYFRDAERRSEALYRESVLWAIAKVQMGQMIIKAEGEVDPAVDPFKIFTRGDSRVTSGGGGLHPVAKAVEELEQLAVMDRTDRQVVIEIERARMPWADLVELQAGAGEGQELGVLGHVQRRQHASQVTVAVIGEGVMTVNGHCTYLPGNKWILNDTYPDKERRQNVYLYHVASGKRLELGAFYSPPQYTGEWRCDTHPRFSPDGKWVVIDSPHTGAGRQMHLIDVGKIVAG